MLPAHIVKKSSRNTSPQSATMRATGGLACQLEMVTHGHEMRFRVLLLVGVAILTSVTAEFEGAHSTVTHLKCLNPRRRRDIHLLPVGGPHFRMASPPV